MAPVGGGIIHEMREYFGPGWRMYYMRRSSSVIWMLGGGEKSTQQSDIQRAIQVAAKFEE